MTLSLSHVTFTGVDTRTNAKRLMALSLEFPFLEWGFLYSPKRAGTPGRYPPVQLLMDAFAGLPLEVRVALHVCGRGVPDLLSGVPEVSELVARVERRGGRIQLNFAQTKGAVDLASLKRFLAEHPKLQVLTQRNQANEGVLEELAEFDNHGVLFDSSGGRGISAGEWPTAIPGVPCGYAGGLGPENIVEELARIEVASRDASRPVWIDMEGKLRETDDTSDWLCLDRCRSVALAVERYLSTA